MVKMQPYVKKWYDFFGEGKIMGLKCKRCGSYEFPPVPVCNSCSGTDLEWTEMSGEAQLISLTAVEHAGAAFAAFVPYLYGSVQLKEGPVYSAIILGADVKKAEELYRKLPVAVRAETLDGGGYKFVAFRVKG